VGERPSDHQQVKEVQDIEEGTKFFYLEIAVLNTHFKFK
jgi:hypothetical protein